jgi:hypothetical protein
LVAGASIMLYEPKEFDRRGNRGRLFKAVLKSYPWIDEGSAMNPEVAIDRIWEMYRNPLAHSLGVPRRGGRELFKVIKFKEALSERQLEALEGPGPRPNWLPPTMVEQENTIKLHVDALYWGTRRMVEVLTVDTPRMARTDQLLSDLEQAAEPPAGMVSVILPTAGMLSSSLPSPSITTVFIGSTEYDRASVRGGCPG